MKIHQAILLIICCLAGIAKANNAYQELALQPKAFFKTSDNIKLLPSRFDNTSKHFRTTLRDIFSIKLNQRMEIGFDSFKISPLEAEHQILKTASFQPLIQKPLDIHRGYGLELRVKLP